MNIVVIGAGFGGLAAGIRLRAQGHEVTILEKCPEPGGRAAVVRQDGFIFDVGPTIITAPQFLDALWALAGRRREEDVRFLPLDPFYRVRFADGSAIACSANDAVMEREVAALVPEDLDGYRRFRRVSRAVFEQAMPLIDRPADTIRDMLRFAPALVRTRAWRSVAAVVGSCVSDPRLRQALSFHPLLIGGHPFHTPALYTLIPELERRWGVWYPLGGMGALVRALAGLFSDMGGKLQCGAEARAIDVDRTSRAVRSVTDTSGRVHPADAIVCNADPGWAYEQLIARDLLTRRTVRRLTKYEYGMSVFVLAFGTNRRYEHVAHHEILMGPRYRDLLDDIFRARRLADDFSIYLHRPTATDASVAPVGCDAFYALVPVPHLGAAIDWTSAGKALRDRIVAHLETCLLPELSRRIVSEYHVDPRHFRDALNAPLGSAFSIEPRLTQSAWFRPRNASADVRQLYFVGAGTHPGAGIPGVLSSAKIAADLIARSMPARITTRSAASYDDAVQGSNRVSEPSRSR